jgi:N1-acetylpolyamine oxidase
MKPTLLRMASNISRTSSHHEVIVIGSGIAGLACANRLFRHQDSSQSHPYTTKDRLLVLEARDRIGGRINAVHMDGGIRLDTGANWIHGTGTDDEPNPLMRILPHKRYRQLQGTVLFQAQSGRPHRKPSEPDTKAGEDDWVEVDLAAETGVLESGEQNAHVLPPVISGPILGAMWGMVGSLHEAAGAVSPSEGKETSMLQAIVHSDILREAYRNTPEQYHSTLAGLPQFVENMEAAPLVAQSAEHSEGQTGMGLLEFATEDFDGDQVFLQDGYTAIIENLAQDLFVAGLVRLGVEVKQIRWNENPITIETNVGTYTANQVVCSIPLGVLQHAQKQSLSGARPLFAPQLPSDKENAIANLGFGTLDKIFLVFDRPWWKEEPYRSTYRDGVVKRPLGSEGDEEGVSAFNKDAPPDSFMGFTTELPGLAINRDGTTSSGPRTLNTINLHHLTGFPVLSTFVSCANASYIESLTDAQAAGIVHRALSEWFGIEVPQPKAVHVTRWAGDPYSRGSYSHLITGRSEPKDREVFQQPIRNGNAGVLSFAGEHTSRNHFATAHGALLSGWREADALLKTPSRS